MTKTYDKIMILNSIVYICAVIIYVLIGPDFFELKNESWDAAQKVVNSIQLVLLFIFLFDNLTQAIAYKLDCIKQPLEILWNILILALIAISFLEILVNGSQQLQITKLSQNFFVLLIKILAAIHKIYLSQLLLTHKEQRMKYLGSRISKMNKQKSRNFEFNDQQFILDAIDDTLMTPQEKILKILKSMR